MSARDSRAPAPSRTENLPKFEADGQPRGVEDLASVHFERGTKLEPRRTRFTRADNRHPANRLTA